MSDADVIVIGAGAAGLMAAQQIVEADLSVIVLEADERVGGRLKAGEVAGRWVDFGGQWAGAGHTLLQAQAARFGVAAYPQSDSGRTLAQLLGRVMAYTGAAPRMPLISLVELAFLQARWDRDMRTVPTESPWTAPKAGAWDAMTLETWILRHLRTPFARAFARLVPRGAYAVEASQISYLWFMDALRAHQGLTRLLGIRGGGQEAKFAGGMAQIPRRMAETLGDRVVVAAPARRIVQVEDGVVVVTDRGEWRAARIIVAIAPGPAARIEYRPHLPASRDSLHQRMAMGAIIKATVAYAAPFWREAGFSGQIATDDDVLGIVMDDVGPTGPPMLMCFIEGRRALEMSAAGKDARRAAVIASLSRFFGDAAADPLAYDDNDWTQEPWTHGYVGTMGPGVMTRYGSALREPCGRIHWAGTETSTEFSGAIEGALRSGVRAAREVIALHNT
ncbi:MAG TPA: FAD-dependent oxidoreductase [Caulobacteraceae bacterium]|nr:FAD-dependent oxidoreductase [Caulobacteraceae bacterium]